MTSLEQLSLSELSGEYTRPKVYENGHKKVLGIWLDLVWKVKYSKFLIFKAIFLCQKSAESLQNNFRLNNTKMGYKLLIIPYFDNFDFQRTLLSKNAPRF